MADAALMYDADRHVFDLAIVAGDVAADDGLATAIAISLFSDARANADDPLPEGADRRGWWGDFAATAGDRLGSRLWLLEREKLVAATALRARDIATEALAWVTADGIAARVDVDVTIARPSAVHPTGALALGVTLTRPVGPARTRFDFLWSATARSLA